MTGAYANGALELREYGGAPIPVEGKKSLVSGYNRWRFPSEKRVREFCEKFPDAEYVDLAGLCGVKTVEEIEAQGWSLNPGRYVGVADRARGDFDFFERLEELNEELEALNSVASELEAQVAQNIAHLLEAQT